MFVFRLLKSHPRQRLGSDFDRFKAVLLVWSLLPVLESEFW